MVRESYQKKRDTLQNTTFTQTHTQNVHHEYKSDSKTASNGGFGVGERYTAGTTEKNGGVKPSVPDPSDSELLFHAVSSWFFDP